MSKKKLELLAPAGSPEKMKYAFAYGADAVYLGIPDFSLRVRINKFGLKSVKQVIDEAHKLKKKAYVTVNIVAHNDHLKRLPKYLKQLNTWQPDALIVSDPGVIQLIKQYAPKLSFHISTQASVCNWQAAKFWFDIGAERVILGREVTLAEIKEIHRRVPKLELEYFVHGAMCMSYSGRCMLSAWLTGRSANLGDCAQPCRWKYSTKSTQNFLETEVEEPLRPGMKIPVEEDKNGTYIFNSKDLCLIEYLGELVDAGIVSFKIEGRAKSIAYLASVVKAYQQGLDLLSTQKDKKVQKRKLKQIKKKMLDSLVHRGYTTGFLFGRDTVEQNIDDSHVGGEEMFVGEVLKCKMQPCLPAGRNVKCKKDSDCCVVVRPHNALRVGDKIRIMQPTGEDLRITIKDMYNEDGEEIESGHGGHKNVVLRLNKKMEEMSILFKIV